MAKSEIILLMAFITCFKKNPFPRDNFPWRKIAEVDGSLGDWLNLLWEKVDEAGSVNFSVIPGPSDSDYSSHADWHILQSFFFSLSIGFIFRMQ